MFPECCVFCFPTSFAAAFAFLAFSRFFTTSLREKFLCKVYESNVRDGNKGGLTGLPCANGTSTAVARRSGNSMPSLFSRFRMLRNGFLAHSRKRGGLGALDVLWSMRWRGEMRPGGVCPFGDRCGETYCRCAEDRDLPEG